MFNDPPLHTRVRRAIVGALSQRHIAAMEPGLVVLVERLLDGLAPRRHVDLIDEFAGAIPVEIIGNLLGVPRDEREPLRRWSLAILGALEPVLTPERADAGNRAVVDMSAYLRTLIDERRAHPQDAHTDVLTRLIEGDADGERLTDTELVHQCIFLLNAGHETTTNLIGNALHALTQWPDQRARLLHDPALIETAVEEFLRFDSSNQLGNRISTRSARVGDVDMPAGSRVTLCIGAANRDPDAVSPIPIDSTLAARPIATSRSASASTPARALTSRASKGGSRSAAFSRASPVTRSTARRPAAAARASGDSSHCRPLSGEKARTAFVALSWRLPARRRRRIHRGKP